MSTENFIAIAQLSSLYNVEVAFFNSLEDYDLIEIHIIENEKYIHQDKLLLIEKVIRLYLDLEINLEGIEVVFKLLSKIDELQNELIIVKNKLRMYESL